MARQAINIGAVANDGTGDPLRTAMDKANTNFAELYDGWRLAGSIWNFSVAVTEVDFTNLGEYSEVMLVMRNVTASTAVQRVIRVSPDNGVNWYLTSGDYVSIANTGVETNAINIPIHGTANAAARSGFLKIHEFNKARIKPVEALVNPSFTHFITQAVALSGIRVMLSAAGNFTGGQMYVLGR